ncbi:hypothetical protein [Vagococcus xieshaowenii]|uniref:Uncharacterized protein n=1 Tax=Vagococcus xieshaowenii TaxID=2562451 RepID=A0AAJ5JLC9_9ENTE|nr:hypothetical protein [Vagococcus xieshaowenii]QCA27897.1 hypothetical protein E4Z98_00450 [Vagococcus xieshaowenii]TFZ39424.1 hypothetical protein E4031_08940 [Vagococcus xieshaowenii]
MQWLIDILAIIIVAIVVIIAFTVVISFVMALYANIRYQQPFFVTWYAKFKDLLVNTLFEALWPFNWF